MTGHSAFDSSYEEDAQKDKFLTFSLGNELYGIEIKHVIEIIGIQTITEVPELPDFVRGIINLRGKIIPVMDVRLRFKKPFLKYNDRTCIIVIEMKETTVGLIVDSVSEVLSVPAADIVPPPEAGGGLNRYIQGIGKSGTAVMLLLDCDKLLHDHEVERLLLAE